jgi:hypothetical protein
MPVMAVNNENPHQQGGDSRSRGPVVGRQEAGGGAAAAARRAAVARARVEAHRLAAWGDDFLAGGEDALKGQRPDRSPDDRALRQAEGTVGQLTMENEIPPAKRPR